MDGLTPAIATFLMGEDMVSDICWVKSVTESCLHSLQDSDARFHHLPVPPGGGGSSYFNLHIEVLAASMLFERSIDYLIFRARRCPRFAMLGRQLGC